MTKTRTRKYFIYRADWGEKQGWRTFTGTRTLTGILNETFDSSGGAIPEAGERLTDDKIDEDGTHYSRWGDWVVDRVESYLPDMPVGQEFTEVVICWCKYDPVESEWKAQGKSIVSIESFGGDRAAFEEWKATATNKDRYRIVEIPEKVVK